MNPAVIFIRFASIVTAVLAVRLSVGHDWTSAIGVILFSLISAAAWEIAEFASRISPSEKEK